MLCENGTAGAAGLRTARLEADLLRDKIYELRIGLQGINYRILYVFSGNCITVLAHAIIKEDEVPCREIDRAVERRKKFELNPKKHTYESGDEHEQE